MDLSVIVPVYNAQATLAGTLDSLLAQKADFPWEIVAVDDGSTDESLSILSDYEKKAAAQNLSLRVFTGPNQGVGRTRNRGLQESRGQCVTYLDADDTLLPGSLSRAMTEKKERGARILVFDSQILFPDGQAKPFPASPHPGGAMSLRDYMLSLPCPWNKIVDRDVFFENHLFFEEGIWYEDLALIPALGCACSPGAIYYLKETLHSYYQSESSIMRSPYTEKKLDIFPALSALRKNAPGHLLEVEYLTWLHLYRNFVWIFWQAGKTEELRKMNLYMKERFPHWKKNPLVREKHTAKERWIAGLIYGGHFNLLRLWKGQAQ